MRATNMQVLYGWRRKMVDLRVALHIFKLAVKCYGSVRTSVLTIKKLYLLKKALLGGIETKIIEVAGKYFHNLYAPGFPSRAFDDYIEAEFNHIRPINKKTNRLTFIIFAITKKCPLQCEHCFEWDNLGSKEIFSLIELKQVVAKFQDDGITQIHLSGGEPMVRVKDLVELVATAGKQSEFYVLSSGFNFNATNARSLKQAGLTGVIFSLDHFDPMLHDAFRGFNNSFDAVMSGIRHAQEQNLVVTLTLCVTRTFLSWNNLMAYANLARQLGVPFIQLLEPTPTGHYQGKDVMLNEAQLAVLEQFYLALNFDRRYKSYPIIVYHGYHQRRIGCFAGGSRSLYIDSNGFVNACPFCQNKVYNIKDSLHIKEDPASITYAQGCKEYKTYPV